MRPRHPDQVVLAAVDEALVPSADLKIRSGRRPWFVCDGTLVAEPVAQQRLMLSGSASGKRKREGDD